MYTEGLYAVMFLSHSPPSGRDAEQVTWRIDRGPFRRSMDSWMDQHFCFALDSDLFLDFLIGADHLIYRIGAGPTLQVLIPEEIEEGVTFFRRQIARHTERP